MSSTLVGLPICPADVQRPAHLGASLHSRRACYPGQSEPAAHERIESTSNPRRNVSVGM